ncbi:uncharacterized protein LOC129884229 [Solanum dulcamara]|uniref:uncharacterized protein LOC129884229 n=1 Tax=Solanum dulcamara TaxID=45834 RepID=UPI0024867537|nr:uncharacterized protein LOC129884229 [Solanum dulcamara]
MNPPEFNGSKVDEELMELIDKVYWIVEIIGVPPNEKSELAAYQLKRVARVWYEQCVVEKDKEMRSIDWEEFKEQIEEEKLRERSKGFKNSRVDVGGFNPQMSDYGNNGKGQGGQRKCGKTHKEECLAGSNACFKCSKLGRHARDFRGGSVGRHQGQIAYGK